MNAVVDTFQLASEIKRKAHDLGFDRTGIAGAHPSKYRDYFRKWLDDGKAGTMQYLAERFAERTDPSIYLPGAASVICVAVNYNVSLPVPSPCTQGEGKGGGSSGRIARYALGDDYHGWIKPRLHALADWLRTISPDAHIKCCVDTAPVMEKELAARAGVGWLGKNSCIINPEIGSWLLLGEIITTIELPADNPAVDRCGSCRRCIDACPTQAITAPYELDARRCISYLTIEQRGEIAEELKSPIGNWLYGCDICQEVCTFNRRAPETDEEAFQPRFDGAINLEKLLQWNDEEYRQTLRGSAMKRVKLPMLQRNARIVLNNQAR
jgi:epoxyqueuosine reductase